MDKKEYLLFIFRNGFFEKHTITNYVKEKLESLFRAYGFKNCTYSIYDLKLNLLDRGKVNSNFEIKELKLWRC